MSGAGRMSAADAAAVLSTAEIIAIGSELLVPPRLDTMGSFRGPWGSRTSRCPNSGRRYESMARKRGT